MTSYVDTREDELDIYTEGDKEEGTYGKIVSSKSSINNTPPLSRVGAERWIKPASINVSELIGDEILTWTIQY